MGLAEKLAEKHAAFYHPTVEGIRHWSGKDVIAAINEAIDKCIEVAKTEENNYPRYGNKDAWEIGFTYGAGVVAEKLRALKDGE